MAVQTAFVQLGDCIDVMSRLPEGCVDSVVCDPPYSLEFMGKSWDTHESPLHFQQWCQQWGTEALRVLKPGGYLLAFGGTRTYHRLVSGLEDAGFEIRDSIHWFYSGFPKSQNVAKMMAKRGLTQEASEWEGWGTTLKPAHEPIVVARKLLSEKTVVGNVLAHGTGALNIDACRIEGEPVPVNVFEEWSGFGQKERPSYTATVNTSGRWPANLILSHSEDCVEAGVRRVRLNSQVRDRNGTDNDETRGVTNIGSGTVLAGAGHGVGGVEETVVYDCAPGCPIAELEEQEEGTSRFFYHPKANKGDRNYGLPPGEKNPHPTVKPTDLMQYLVRLVTPLGGVVLGPFAGSGSTGVAAVREGFGYIGIEKDPEYAKVAEARIGFALREREAK